MPSHFIDELWNFDDETTTFNSIFEWVMIITPVVTIFVYAIIFIIRGASPKYVFFRPLKIAFYTHLALGVTQYILFFVILFYTSSDLIFILSIINILHSLSIFGMFIGVSGEKYWMIPTYFWIIIIKLYYSYLLFEEPLSYPYFISLYYIHSFFGWGRIFFIIMSQTYLFENCIYSMSSVIGSVVSLSQAFTATSVTNSEMVQYMTLFFLLVIVSAIFLRIYKPSFIIDNDQTNDNLFNVFNKHEIETILNKFDAIDNNDGNVNNEMLEILGDNDDNDWVDNDSIKDKVHLAKFRVLLSVLFDADGDYKISLKEFSEIFTKKMGYNIKVTQAIWEFADQDNKGWICLNDATKLFANDNPHFNLNYMIDKLHKFLLEIQKKHNKKDEIVRTRNETIDANINKLVSKYTN